MLIDLLQNLGFTPIEAKIYKALLTYGGSGVSTIALRAKVHRRNAYDAIHRLIEKGLAFEVFTQGETIYEAVNPTKILEIVQGKEKMVQDALPHMLALQQKNTAVERAYIYKGLEGLKNYMREIIRVGRDVHCFAAKGGWCDARLGSFSDWFFKEAKRKKMHFHNLFDEEVQHKLPDILPHFTQYKFLPQEYSTHATINIFGDYVVTFTGLQLAKHEEDISFFIIQSPDLAESYRTWWKLLWEVLP